MILVFTVCSVVIFYCSFTSKLSANLAWAIQIADLYEDIIDQTQREIVLSYRIVLNTD